jgi:YhcG PDDEXK nuclease domain
VILPVETFAANGKQSLNRLSQPRGQPQMYVNYFDRFVKANGENSTIGIILCKKQNKALVEITLPKDANIHAREYQLYLPSKEELQRKLAEWIKESSSND